MWIKPLDFEATLLGKTLSRIEVRDDELYLETTEGTAYKLYHEQDCCETVTIEDICGDLGDLIGSPLVQVSEISFEDEKDLPEVERVRRQIERANALDNYEDESQTWTFYKLGTNKGSVTIRWYGSSNGYYSESVDFGEVPVRVKEESDDHT